jgi:hypothetical protein
MGLFALDYPQLAFLITDIGLTKQAVRNLYKEQNIVEGKIPNSLSIKSGNNEIRIWIFNENNRCSVSVIVINYETNIYNDFVNYWISHGFNKILLQNTDKNSSISSTRLLSITGMSFIHINDNPRAKMLELSVTSSTGSPYDVIPFLGEWGGRSGETGQFHTLKFTIGSNNKILFEENRILRGEKVLVERGEIQCTPDTLLFLGTSEDLSRRFTFSWKFDNEDLILLDSKYIKAK